VDPSAEAPDVAVQDADPNSHLNLVRARLSLRHKHPALGGLEDFRILYAKTKACPFVYERTAKDEQFVIVLNPSA